MIKVTSSGSFSKLTSFYETMRSNRIYRVLNQHGRDGVALLRSATPVDTGKTADSWQYRIVNKSGRYGIEWYNTNTNDGVNVAVLIQYGHGTGTGGYVSGTDYINPTLRPLFDKIADDVWRQVRNA